MNKFAYLVAASAIAMSAFAQGTIDIGNRAFAYTGSVATGSALVNDASGKPLTGTSYVAQIFYGASAASLNNSFAPVPFRASTTTYPGTWNPGASAIQELTGVGYNQTVTLQVRVWDSAIAGAGADTALAKAAGTGLSETFTYKTGADALAIPTGMENLKSFSLVGSTPVIPEPTTVALGAIGAAALLLRRRK